MMLSTVLKSSLKPASATFFLGVPSNQKGMVTKATESMPYCLAISAITAAEPVPVPPPIPAAMKTRSAPFMISSSSSRLSSAAFFPTAGSPPEPSPLVILSPICILFGALFSRRACLSVLIPMNSTPATFSSIMRFTALLPAPPTPTTMIRAARSELFDFISSKTVSSYEPTLF